MEKEEIVKGTRERKIQKNIYFSEDEWKMILVNMFEMGTENFSQYARKALVEQQIVLKEDNKDVVIMLKKIHGELGKIGANINQIAHRANETRSVHRIDLLKIKHSYYKELPLIREMLSKAVKALVKE